MSFQNLVPMAEVLNALAVMLTLVALVISIRQNTAAQKVFAVQSLSTAIAALNEPAMASPALGAALASTMKDWNAASREDRIVAHFFLFSYFKLIETAWYQRQAGALETDQWAGWEKVMRSFYHSDGVRGVWWPNRREAYSPAFQRYVEETEPPHGIAGLGDIFADVALPP